jgi:hypothetical protein
VHLNRPTFRQARPTSALQQYGRFFQSQIFENSFKINNMIKFNAEKEADITKAIEYLERTLDV